VQAAIELVTNLRLSEEIIAKDVSYEAFLSGLYGQHVEWYEGYVIRMAGIDERHDALTNFFTVFFEMYLDLTGGGRALRDPMVMRTSADLPVRAPDIQVLLPGNLHFIKQNEFAGPADLVIEVISPGSERTDRIEKFNEYERAGIPEYWLLDHRHQEALFYQLNTEGHYQRINPDENNIYHSVVLKELSFEVALLWRDELPKGMEIVRMVEAMLTEP
jgi:Uma2 family endonuclease